MFESLTDKLQSVFEKLTGKGRLTEQDIDEAMREVRIALLEADVNFRVVKDFLAQVKEKAMGQDILQSLTAGQSVIKIVRDQMVELLGGQPEDIQWSPTPPTIFLLCGLQGSGKTTTAGKLGRLLKSQGNKPMLVAADVQRPAAIKQLEVLGEQNSIPVFAQYTGAAAPYVVRSAIQAAQTQGCDVLIVDTAGRLQIDEALMSELKQVKSVLNPHQTLLVVDATTGQEAVNVAQTFDEQLGVTGVIVTKMDSDARGGAILSVRAVTGKPIRYVGSGEKSDAIEPFFPDRVAGRILGMGDVLSLIERAEQAIDMDKAKEMEKRLKTKQLDFNDFLEQMKQVRKMGPLDQIMGMIPGMGKLKQMAQGATVDEKHLNRLEAIIYSMTKAERAKPELLNGSRRKRIADGAGVTVHDVNELVKQLMQMRDMLKMFMGGKFPGMPGAGGGKKKGKKHRMMPRF